MKQHHHQQQPLPKSSEKVPSNIKLVLILCALLIVLLVSQHQEQQQQQQQHGQQQASSSTTFHHADVAVISSTKKKNTKQQQQQQNKNVTPTTTSTITTTTAIKPRLFTCGFDLWNLGPELFGDLQHVGRFGEETTATDGGGEAGENDILLQGGLNGPCHQSPLEFPGKVLFVNSEARINADKFVLEDRFFQLGPIGGDHHSIVDNIDNIMNNNNTTTTSNNSRALPMVTFGAIFFVSATTPQQRQWILDPTQRPQGTNNKKQNNDAVVVFVVNRCGGSRKEVALQLSQQVPNLTIHQNPKCQTKNNKSPTTNNFHAIPKKDWTPRKDYRENYKLYAKYKYCLVLENTNTVPEYLTEKLFLAFLGGCLPIYGGSRQMVLEIFHKDAFVFWDPDAPHRAIQELQDLESNQTLYQEKMAAPILAHGIESANAYLSLAQDVGDGRLRSRIRNMLGIVIDHEKGL